MHHDRMKPDVLHQDDVPSKAVPQHRVHHRMTAVLDDEDIPMELPNIRERLLESGCFLDQVIHALRIAYGQTPTAAGWLYGKECA